MTAQEDLLAAGHCVRSEILAERGIKTNLIRVLSTLSNLHLEITKYLAFFFQLNDLNTYKIFRSVSLLIK